MLRNVGSDVESTPISATKQCCLSPENELAVQVESKNTPIETTAASIQPLIATIQDIESSARPYDFPKIVVACRVCQQSAASKTAVVQIAKSSHQHVYLTRNILLGNTAPVSVAPNTTISAIQTDGKTTESMPNELRAAFPMRLTRPRPHLANVHPY